MDTTLRMSLNFLNTHLKKIYELDQVKGRIGAIKAGKKQILPVYIDAGENAEKPAEKAAEGGVDKANKAAKKEKFKK